MIKLETISIITLNLQRIWIKDYNTYRVEYRRIICFLIHKEVLILN